MSHAENVDLLIVEDNPNDAELTLHALGLQSLVDRVLIVVDGAEALDFFFGTGAFEGRDVGRQPRVVFLDLKLPKVDGLEVLRRVKADERTRHVPVVVLTSSREEQDVQKAYRFGANSYIVKPVDFERFAEAIGRVGLYWLSLNQPPA